MFRNLSRISLRKSSCCTFIQKQSFLTNDYKCKDAWNTQTSSPILTKVNLNDLYNILDQNFSSKGVISAIDVDIFANAIKSPAYLEELKDLLYKLRRSAETINTLESTHHATIRNFIEFGHVQELMDILKDPISFGIFLDNYAANILLDMLINAKDYNNAASVASLVMLQEEFTNNITCALCQYACFKHITTYNPPPKPTPEEKPKKVEEIKIRIKFLRNEYFDDHFDLKDPLLLSGKTLAWISERSSDNVSNNLQIIGWLMFKKYDKLLSTCVSLGKTLKVFPETIDLLKKEGESAAGEIKELLNQCTLILSKASTAETSLEDSLKNHIENAINKVQNIDIKEQQELFKTWAHIREEKLEEQNQRLDRAKRMQLIQEKQDQLKQEEQRLWFFENEEELDLQIEEKEKLVETPSEKKSTSKSGEDYIPPEILRKRK